MVVVVVVAVEVEAVVVKMVLELSSKCFYLGGFITKVTTQD